MRISDEELEAMEPVHAVCADAELIVTLANGQKVITPLWWYPRLLKATPKDRANYELSPFGVHLIQCAEIRQGEKTLADCRDEVYRAVAQQLFDSLANDERRRATVEVIRQKNPGTER